MQIKDTIFADAKLIIPDVYEDSRGFFKETYQSKRFIESGLPFTVWAQDGVSYSVNKYTLRGLHWQNNMKKFVNVMHGSVYDVIVDIRSGSPTYKKWQKFLLSAENHHQLFIPEGFAHGFITLTPAVVFSYKMSDVHNKATEHTLKWNSPEIGIDWELPENFDTNQITISEKDENAPSVL